jgi:hypothetical protein
VRHKRTSTTSEEYCGIRWLMHYFNCANLFLLQNYVEFKVMYIWLGITSYSSIKHFSNFSICCDTCTAIDNQRIIQSTPVNCSLSPEQRNAGITIEKVHAPNAGRVRKRQIFIGLMLGFSLKNALIVMDIAHTLRRLSIDLAYSRIKMLACAL